MILHNSVKVAQNLSRRNSHVQINCVRLTYGHRDKHEQYSGSVQNNVKRALEVLAKIVDSAVLRHEENQEHPGLEDANRLSLSEPVNQPSLGVSVNGIAGSNPDQLSGSDLAFLRWRRLISPCMAELMNCPVLSPGFFTCSMPSMISCAMRAVTDCDFAFFEPVAMSTFSKNECKTLYTKIYCLEVLTCKTPLPYRVSYTLFELRCENSEARQCGNTNRASDHQDS